MTRLRLIAPVRVDLSVIPGAADRDPDEYRTFWMQAVRAVAEDPLSRIGKVLLPHASVREASSQYESLEVDSLERTLHIALVDVDVPAYREHVQPSCDSRVLGVSLLLFEHGIALVEIDVDSGAPPSRRGAYRREAWLDELRTEGIGIAEQAAVHLNAAVVAPLARLLRQIDRRNAIIRAIDAQDTDGQAMWVSRALVVAPSERSLLEHWTRGAVSAADRAARQSLIDGDRDSLVRWLNYAFIDKPSAQAETLTKGRHANEWAGLRYSQATYAALDRIDNRLSHVLALAAAAQQRWELESLRRDLIELSGRAEMIVIQRHALAKYLPREVRSHMDEVLTAWEYESLLEEPVRFKIELCGRRLDDLAAKRTARAGVVTDLILLGIGVTSIASIALAITEFGRSSTSNPDATAYDLGGSDVTSWFATQPIDVILLISGAASVAVVALYLYFRRDDGG